MGKKAVVLLTDFGLKDRFVGSMKGVVYSVDRELDIFDLTHDIKPFAVREASEILAGVIAYWPEETVFVSVVDPGVGTERKSVAVRTNCNRYIVTPDNGSLTHVYESRGLREIRIIDERIHRLPGSEGMNTFHGRDVYAYNAARLAAGKAALSDLGAKAESVVLLENPKPYAEDGALYGFVSRIEEPYGNLVTNIPASLFERELHVQPPDEVKVEIKFNGQTIMQRKIRYLESFGRAAAGEPLVYADSTRMTGIAMNLGNLASAYKIGSGAEWLVVFQKT